MRLARRQWKVRNEEHEGLQGVIKGKSTRTRSKMNKYRKLKNGGLGKGERRKQRGGKRDAR